MIYAYAGQLKTIIHIKLRREFEKARDNVSDSSPPVQKENNIGFRLA